MHEIIIKKIIIKTHEMIISIKTKQMNNSN